MISQHTSKIMIKQSLKLKKIIEKQYKILNARVNILAMQIQNIQFID